MGEEKVEEDEENPTERTGDEYADDVDLMNRRRSSYAAAIDEQSDDGGGGATLHEANDIGAGGGGGGADGEEVEDERQDHQELAPIEAPTPTIVASSEKGEILRFLFSAHFIAFLYAQLLTLKLKHTYTRKVGLLTCSAPTQPIALAGFSRISFLCGPKK